MDGSRSDDADSLTRLQRVWNGLLFAKNDLELVGLQFRLPQGFAAAVMPVTATAITTDTHGLTAGEVEIPTGDLRIPGYRAKPAGSTAFPVVWWCKEIFWHPRTSRTAGVWRRMGISRWRLISMHARARLRISKSPGDFRGWFRILSPTPGDGISTRQWVGGERRGRYQPSGCNRLLLGGRIVWLYAAYSSQLKAGAAWYGRLAGPTSEKQPKNPIDIVNDLKAR